MRTRTISAAAIVALVGVSACGSASSASRSPGDRITAAGIARATAAARTARLEMSQRQGPSATGAAAANEIAPVITMTGEVDFEHHRGEGRTAPGASTPVEVRWLGKLTYLRTGSMPATQGRWLQFGPGGGEEGLSVHPLAAFVFSPDPLGLLRALPAGARTIGHETVRGVDTTHLRFDLDLRALTKQLRAEGYTLDDPPVATTPADIWVDGQGRLRRLSTSDTSNDPPTPATLELFDFGVHVDVQAPPSDQIMHGDTGSSSSVSAYAPGQDPSQR